MMMSGSRLTRMICGPGIELEEGVELAQLQEVERRIRAALADAHKAHKGKVGNGSCADPEATPLPTACELAAYEYVVQALLARAIRQTLTRTRGSRTGIVNMPCFP